MNNNLRLKPATLGRLVSVVALAIVAGVIFVSGQDKPITRQEMLRGTITPEREWWDVQH